MAKQTQLAFKTKGKEIPLDNILPSRMVPKGAKNNIRYKRIEASMKEVGIIEPPIVFPQNGNQDTYLMLDGHIRLEIARTHGKESIFCLIATDDEAFTYNHRVNQLNPIQEHFMIQRAIKNGVSEGRIARTLNVETKTIRKKRNLLDGICEEAVELLRTRKVAAEAIRAMRQVTPIRQIEIAELMAAANNFTVAYAQCLVAATSEQQRVDNEKTQTSRGMSPEDIAKLQKEMQHLEREFTLVQNEYGQNMLNLVVAAGYVRSLLNNAAVVRFISKSDPSILVEFQRIVEDANPTSQDK